MDKIQLNPSPYPSKFLCAACGRHPVPVEGWLCNSADDKGIWHCAEWSAAFAAPFLGVRWPKEYSATAENRVMA